VKVIAVLLGVILIGAAVAIPVVLLTRQSPVAQAPVLYKKAMQAGGTSAGFHYVETWTGGGPTAIFSGDVGQSDGVQENTQTTDFGAEQFQIVLAPDQTAYFEGNVAALEDQLGVSASAAPGLTTTWISVRTTDAPYQYQVEGVTAGSALIDGQLTPTSTEQITGSGGISLTRIQGTVSNPTGTAHLDVSPASDLPVSFVASYDQDGSSYSETMTFTQWGRAPSVTVPSNAVAWSTLTTSAPRDGYGSGETPTPAPAATPTPSGVGSAA
jgi:hypothetical protein